MGVSPVFEWVGTELERRSSLSLIEARGTVRLLLKQAGLEPGSVSATQMDVVLRRLMPRALELRGIGNGESLSEQLAQDLASAAAKQALEPTESAYDVFERLGRRSKPEKDK